MISAHAPTLGVVAISFNEEKDLPGFLDNLLPWVDEIVIVDDGSADRTMEIASAAGDHVILLRSPRETGEYYADQRNKGIDASKSEWLLHMDVDERVTPALAKEIRSAIHDERFDAYRFRRLNYFLHRPMRGGGLADWNQIHLARRDCLRFGGMFHEEILLNVNEARVGQLKAQMLHFNDESYSERLEKSANYQHEIAGRIQQKGIKVGYWRIAASFALEFLYKYFWKRGFLDGTPGLIWAIHSAGANARANTLVWDEQNKIERFVLEDKLQKDWARVDG